MYSKQISPLPPFVFRHAKRAVASAPSSRHLVTSLRTSKKVLRKNISLSRNFHLFPTRQFHYKQLWIFEIFAYRVKNSCTSKHNTHYLVYYIDKKWSCKNILYIFFPNGLYKFLSFTIYRRRLNIKLFETNLFTYLSSFTTVMKNIVQKYTCSFDV